MTPHRRLVAAGAIIALAAAPLGASAGIGRQPPVNVTLPAVSGTPAAGQPVSADAGTWSGKTPEYAYQWLACDAAGGGCTALAGATAATYVVASGPATIRVAVTATNRNGSATATSPQRAVVSVSDRTAPSVPNALVRTGATLSSVGVAWGASSDDVGVAGYRLFVNGGAAGTTGATSFTASGLACGASVDIGVEAYDAAGNSSARAALDTTTSACVSANPSGEAMPGDNVGGWRQIFADDFSTNVPLGSFPAAVSTKWKPYPYPWKDTSKNGTYWPQKGLSAHDGLLDVWLHTETVNGVATHIVNAPQPILPGPTRGQLYGRYVIRFRADPVPGYKTAWLLWPDSGLRTDGEIDFPEGNLSSTIHAYMHRQGATSGSDQDAYSTGISYTSWHTAVIEWLPSRCTFILDGKVIGNSTSRIPATPMHYVIQTETQLSGGAPANTASGHVYIDWVAVYARA